MKSTSHGQVDRAHQVGQEEDGALQHADEQRLAAGVVARDLRAQLARRGAAARPAGRGSRRSPRRPCGRAVYARARRAPRRSAALGAQHAALDDRAHAAAEVEHRACRCGAAPATSSAWRAAPGTSRPAAPSASRCTTSRAQRRRQRGEPLERDRRRRPAAVELLGHERVEHLGLVAQQRGGAQHVRRGGRVDRLAAPARARGARGCARSLSPSLRRVVAPGEPALPRSRRSSPRA